ncbi:TPA: PcfJ domain-containing protein [Pseudomonas aeruginosa]|uniref:PcfJ domain-containing protein n=1 Tax=Pseudomonas aeruginosa TaxID=287 RepID=UPI0005C53FB5|nr:PcfJ domain-containing protein [Pseudomonas aeruginosa]MDK8399206.1 PcfJ domain-containing protein [Pseudomonas aeruginosa]MDK8439498.1 PcfJ domain-containing protein [Pseudomonas aeruginosa]MDK8557983.1 PcfJ domain-containing protein [Pseudomonas aeruginosa]MDV6777950.1 hypothetical protein [Pseudomonas aeruginosa]WCI73139.1 PcfJ domain-containing protein [Pseudomonas aeruginosa]
MDATKLYKAMWDVSRTPKPWEALHAEWESFKQFAEGVPESTQEALIPLLWHARDRLQYLDGGGLNGHLKEHGLTKAGWKRVCSLSIEETVELYRVYQVQRDWLAGVPAVVQLCADAAAPATAKGIQVLMNVPFGQVEELPKVLQQERYLLVRKAVEHAQELGQVELEGFRQQLLMMLDYIDVEGFAVEDSTSIELLWASTEAWHATLHDLPGEDRPLDASANQENVAPTPGGLDVFEDLESGLQVVRLQAWDQFVGESDLMMHCIGRSPTYFNRHIAGNGAFYSLRRPGENRPAATVELLKPRDEWLVQQCRGVGNADPGPQAHALATRLAEAHNLGGMVLSSELRFDGRGDELDNYQLNGSSARYF